MVARAKVVDLGRLRGDSSERRFDEERRIAVFELGRERFLVVPQADLPRAVVSGRRICDDPPAGQLVVGDETYVVVKDVSANAEELDPAELLTSRELQIAHLVARGHCTKRIADLLHISEWTVLTHLRRAFAKLRVDSRAAMVYRCRALLDRGDDCVGGIVFSADD